jgi:rieske iron-sulfur protein
MRTTDQNQGALLEGRRNSCCRCVARAPARREILKGALGLGFAFPFVGVGTAEETNPTRARPKAGDRLVFAVGDRKGQLVAPDDLPLGGPQVLAYPMDPKSGVIRDGSRLNQVAVVRLDPKELGKETRADAADGVVAYSAVCTHQGCPISMWEDKAQTLFCSCHASEFDPRNGAEVVAGPARRRLAALPLKIEDGVLVAVAEFSGRVGFK